MGLKTKNFRDLFSKSKSSSSNKKNSKTILNKLSKTEVLYVAKKS